MELPAVARTRENLCCGRLGCDRVSYAEPNRSGRAFSLLYFAALLVAALCRGRPVLDGFQALGTGHRFSSEARWSVQVTARPWAWSSTKREHSSVFNICGACRAARPVALRRCLASTTTRQVFGTRLVAVAGSRCIRTSESAVVRWPAGGVLIHQRLRPRSAGRSFSFFCEHNGRLSDECPTSR
jgi:hypothetical protein